MLCILRCQTLKRPLRWSAKPLAHWQSSIRPLSQSSTLSFRPTLRFRQDKLAPPLKEKVEPVESFYEKVGKPQIRNQVLVSRVALLFPLSNFVSLNKVLASSYSLGHVWPFLSLHMKQPQKLSIGKKGWLHYLQSGISKQSRTRI